LVAVKGKHGATLAGRYRLLEQLGEGGMGSVWKAEHLLLHSHVAVKIIDPEIARLEFNLARFLREAKTLATLRSPNVVQVLDFGSDAETPYLVMELLQGQTLGRRLSEQGRLTLSETCRVLQDVCAAMSLVHEQGLIHRDLKPENIFLCNVGGQRVTKVVDFGIAKSLRSDMTTASMKTRTGHMLGTPSYMSPEQCRGLKDIDHRADLWALGVIAYECLVGKVPFEGEVLGDLLLRICMDPLPIPSRQARGALPAAFDAWFAKAVARDRSTRYQSALELATSLSALSPAVSSPAHSSPMHSAPAHSSPTLGSPTHSSPAHSPPTHEAIEASRPSVVPRISFVPPMPVPRPPSNTETNTTVGLVGASRRVERRARAALAAAAVVAVLGLWAIGNKRNADGAVNVDMQSLRPPYEVTPKAIRPGVPSGRRWQPSGASPHNPPWPSNVQPSNVRPAEGLPPVAPEQTGRALAAPAPEPAPLRSRESGALPNLAPPLTAVAVGVAAGSAPTPSSGAAPSPPRGLAPNGAGPGAGLATAGSASAAPSKSGGSPSAAESGAAAPPAGSGTSAPGSPAAPKIPAPPPSAPAPSPPPPPSHGRQLYPSPARAPSPPAPPASPAPAPPRPSPPPLRGTAAPTPSRARPPPPPSSDDNIRHSR
jgi:serine/threonine-protein kinase